MLTVQVLKQGAEFDLQMNIMNRSDVKSMLDFISSMFMPMIEAKNMKLTTQIVNHLYMPDQFENKRDQKDQPLLAGESRRKEPQLPPILIFDERRLKQVLINLVKNATKFTSDGEIEIKMGYDYANSSLVVHVRDTGRGIAQRDLHKLFNRFGKLERTANQNSEGIGLGLTIVKTIVENSGGKIVAISDGIDKGATFCFSIKMPAFENEQQAQLYIHHF